MIEAFKEKLRKEPEIIMFEETLSVIDKLYNFRPTFFTNGKLHNAEGKNSGSCKVFAFARKQGLSKNETLACFGQYYFKEVLENPEGDGHQNIRNFMKTGFKGLSFEEEPLEES